MSLTAKKFQKKSAYPAKKSDTKSSSMFSCSSLDAMNINYASSVLKFNESGFANIPLHDDKGDTLTVTFTNPLVLKTFQMNQFQKLRSKLDINPLEVRSLEQLAAKLTAHEFTNTGAITVKTPHYNGTVEIGWPTKGAVTLNGVSVSMEELNDALTKQAPQSIECTVGGWGRQSEDDECSVGIYYQVGAVDL